MVENVKSGITINVDVSATIPEIVICAWNFFFLNSSTWTCENGKYLRSITGESVITCDEITNYLWCNYLWPKLL